MFCVDQFKMKIKGLLYLKTVPKQRPKKGQQTTQPPPFHHNSCLLCLFFLKLLNKTKFLSFSQKPKWKNHPFSHRNIYLLLFLMENVFCPC